MQQKLVFAITVICLFGQLNAASLNNGNLNPRSERAESITTDGFGHHHHQQSSTTTTSNQTSAEQLEFDFVNLPGYGVLDDANSSQSGNFSCYGRKYGYYADIYNHQCKLFHLCYPVKNPNNGDIVYQRFSFACSDESKFDQQHLLCLEPSSVITPCDQSTEQYFDSSNRRLVDALQKSAPGLFSLSEEGAVLNATNHHMDMNVPASADSATVLDGSALTEETESFSLPYGHEQFYA